MGRCIAEAANLYLLGLPGTTRRKIHRLELPNRRRVAPFTSDFAASLRGWPRSASLGAPGLLATWR
eukprot:572930-Amphidinium_carterae.1